MTRRCSYYGAARGCCYTESVDEQREPVQEVGAESQSRSRARRIGWTVAILAIVGYVSWQFSFPIREAKRWEGCLGKTLVECQIPADYSKTYKCPVYLECSTNPPGDTYLAAQLGTRKGWTWSSYAYAVIALDREGRIVEVEVKHFYAVL